MGNQIAYRSCQTWIISGYISELVDYTFLKSLNSSRFFKVALCEYKKNKYDVLLCIVKGFIKHESDSKLHIANYKEELESIKERLHNVPNVLPYYAIIETESCLFLTRQYISQTLYERMSTRPFLTLIEKKWIAFQMLQALKFCKDRGVRHGDIKSENVLITSWNWVLLTDFAIFKPTFLRKASTQLAMSPIVVIFFRTTRLLLLFFLIHLGGELAASLQKDFTIP
jgi:phosphoinositide-3-kinase regulatory subunit 4